MHPPHHVVLSTNFMVHEMHGQRRDHLLLINRELHSAKARSASESVASAVERAWPGRMTTRLSRWRRKKRVGNATGTTYYRGGDELLSLGFPGKASGTPGCPDARLPGAVWPDRQSDGLDRSNIRFDQDTSTIYGYGVGGRGVSTPALSI